MAQQTSNQDPLANIITQVSPTGHQPGRAPARPARARPAAKGKNKQSKPQPNPESASQSASVAPSQTPITPIQHSAAASPEDKRIPSSQDSSVEDGSRLSNPHDASSTLVEAPAAPDAAIRDAEKTPQTYPPTSSAPQPASAAPAAPSNQNTNPTSTNQPKKGPQSTKGRKKKSGPSPWTSFLIALGCVSKRAYDDPEQQTDSASSTKPSGQPLKRTRSAEKHDANLHENSKQTSSSPSSSSSPSAQPAVPATEVTPPSPAHDVPQQTQLPGPSTAGSASDRGFASASQRPDHSSSDLPVTPAEPSVSSAPSTSGIPLPKEETGNVTSGAVVPPGADGHSHHATPKKRRSKSSTRTTDSFEDEQQAADLSSEGEDLAGADSEEDDESMFQQDDEEERIIQAGGMGIPVDEDGIPRPLLAPLADYDTGRKCLVLDLDETLVHSSFKQISAADYIVPVEIENQTHNVFVIKRPGVDEFLRRMGEIYEVVVFTASLSKYADPVLDQLDIHRVVRHRLFRESCYNHKGNYVKDLSQLGRPISDCIIIDNSPASYIFHPKNAVPVSSWFNDPHDSELIDMIGVLADLADVDDVRSVLDGIIDQ